MKIKNSARGHAFTEDDIAEVVNAMQNADTYTQGSNQKKFENLFSEYLDTKMNSYAVSSGTAALELAAILSNVGKNDEVIIPAHTFAATAIPFARTGAKIRWADIDPDKFVVSVESIKKLISPSTKVIVAVHLYGLMANMPEIMKLANQYGILVVEDCAQAIGAEINGRKAGTFGNFSCFSFHSHKHLTTLGEGGMFLVRDNVLALKVNGLKHNGLRKFEGSRDKYWKPAMSNVDFDIEGFWPYNFCIGEVQCAVGISILKRLDELVQRRIDRASRIIDSLVDCPEISFQYTPEGYKNSYYGLPAFLNPKYGISNDSLISLLYKEFNITAIVQYYPLYRYPLFIKGGHQDHDCENTNLFYDNMIAFPNNDELNNNELDYLINSIKSAIKQLR
jgi:perosamine synthetase